jgi:hypothetical protein
MKNLKTFIISKFQIQSLRNLLIANGETAEAEKFSGADLALRWKCCNLDAIGSKNQKESFQKQYPYFIGYDLQSQVAPAKETAPTEPAPTGTSPEATEMSAPTIEPAPTKKGKNKRSETTEA